MAGRQLILLLATLAAAVAVAVPLAFLVRAGWAPLVRLDDGVEQAAHRAVLGSSWLLEVAKALSVVGHPLVATVVMLGLAVLLGFRGHRRLAVLLVVARAGAQLLSSGAKYAVDRARPAWPDPVSQAAGPSFPSGHSLASATLYASVLVVALSLAGRWIRRAALVLTVVMPLAVAASRVLLGVHYLSDVVAGLALGFGWVVACTAILSGWLADDGRPAAQRLEPIR